MAAVGVNPALGAPLGRHTIIPDVIATEVMRTTDFGLSVNYNELVIQLAALLASQQEAKLKLISNTLSTAMNTLVKHSDHKSIQAKHKLNNYFKAHITKTFPIFFDKLQEELARPSPGYTDLLRIIFPKWIKSDAAREILEGQDPTYQCDVTRRQWFKKFLDPSDNTQKKRGCWICGHELHLWKGALSGPQCEHKSPVLLAMLHYRLIQVPLTLYDTTFNSATKQALGQVVLEWSCVLCNMTKNALNLVLDDKVHGRYVVHEHNVNIMIEEIKSKLGKVNLGRTIQERADNANILPVWDGNSLFLTDAEYHEKADDIKEEEMADGIREQIRTIDIDKSFTNTEGKIGDAKEQFDRNKPRVIQALQELADISNSAITNIKSTIEANGAPVSQYQSYEIYTLLISVRLLCNIHGRKLIPFMISAIDNPNAKPSASTSTPSYTKATKVSKLKGVKAAKPYNKPKGVKKGGGFMNSLEEQFNRVDFVIDHFETLIIAGIINEVKDDWFIFSDYVDLYILQENGLNKMNDFDKTFNYIRERFIEKREIFEAALNKSITEIYRNFNDDFDRINDEYITWNNNWRMRGKELLDSELKDIIAKDDESSEKIAIMERSTVTLEKIEKAKHDNILFLNMLKQAKKRHDSNPYSIAINSSENVQQKANVETSGSIGNLSITSSQRPKSVIGITDNFIKTPKHSTIRHYITEHNISPQIRAITRRASTSRGGKHSQKRNRQNRRNTRKNRKNKNTRRRHK